MAGGVQSITYVNTADTPVEVWDDALDFFVNVLDMAKDDDEANAEDLTTVFKEASIKLNKEGRGDGKPWRGSFVYDGSGQ